MYQFQNTLPSRNNDSNPKTRSLNLFIRPTTEGEFYRFRLLNFIGNGVDRTYPFIERFVHTHWGKTDDGKSIIDGQVVCPVTKWVKNWTGDRYDCPICKVAGQYFGAFKESGWKDKAANKKSKEFGRKFEAIIPVYVVQDPLYVANNGKFRAITLTDKETYKALLTKIQTAQNSGVNVFNGSMAVDCAIHMSVKENIVNPGTPNEYKWHERVIDRIAFTKTPYDIAAITPEALNFGFDEEFYQSSTPAEIHDFFNKYVKMSNDDIPLDDEVPATPVRVKAPTVKPEVKQTISNVKPVDTVVEAQKVNDVDLGESPEDPLFDIGDDTSAPAATTATKDESIDDILNSIDL